MGSNNRLLVLFFLSLVLFVGFGSSKAFAENYTVTIPFGASDPNFDTPAKEWFTPSVISINSGDMVTWINDDNDGHTVISGKGISRIGFATSQHPVPNGIFSSDVFKPGQSWSYTFDKPGTFHYFCDIHPWMNGAVVVNEIIPNSATDSSGNEITKWPIVEYTAQKEYEADLSWEPHIILTGQKETFVFQFYDPMTSQTLRGTSYEFVIFQKGMELLRVDGQTEIGGDYKYFVFKDSGPVTFRLEKINGHDLYTEYSTIVYKNPNETNTNIPVIQPARNLVLSQEILVIFIAPPIGIVIFIFLWLKWGSKFRKGKSESKEPRSAI